MNKIRLLSLCAALISMGSLCGGAQTPTDQHIIVTITSKTPEEKVADSIKENQLRETAENKIASEKSAALSKTNPKQLLATGRTINVSTETSYFESIQLEKALMDRTDFESSGVAIAEGYKGAQIADILVEIDRPLFTFYFTYKITDRSTGLLLVAGKLTAFDGNAAAPLLAKKIMEEIHKAREEALAKK